MDFEAMELETNPDTEKLNEYFMVDKRAMKSVQRMWEEIMDENPMSCEIPVPVLMVSKVWNESPELTFQEKVLLTFISGAVYQQDQDPFERLLKKLRENSE